MSNPFNARSAGSLLLALCALLFFLSPRPADAAITLQAYDRNGVQLTPAQMRSTMAGAGWDYTDTLIHPKNMQVLKAAPLYNGNGGLVFDPLTQAGAIAINWPTRRGYSLLVIDRGGAGYTTANKGTVNLTYQAARDVKRRLDAALTARPSYRMSSAFIAAYQLTDKYLATATASTSASVRGKYGQLALDELAKAQDLMLYEYGVAYTRNRLATRPPQIGLTLDRINSYARNLDRIKQIGGSYAWVRIVFDPGMAPSHYAAMVNAAKARGIKVLGQPIDSYHAKTYSRSAYLARIKAYVDYFPKIDAWEVGNEVNGSWLGAGMGPKIADAAAYVRSKRPGAKVFVTLYWQIGTDYAQWSTFNWVRANLPATTRANIDVIALSAYVEDAPLGLAMDQVFNALHAEFPKQKIMFGELDYWLPDTSRAWWAFSAGDSAGAARRGVAKQYYGAALGYSYSLGGGYWWNAAEDIARKDLVLDTIAGVAAKATR